MGCVHQSHKTSIPKSYKKSVLQSTAKYKSKVLSCPQHEKKFKDDVLPRILWKLQINHFKLQLIFQASRAQFSANKFHLATDGAENTILIAHADTGVIFGGFSPSKWENDVMYKYVSDERKISFLFRFHDQSEKESKVSFFQIMEQQQNKAILNNEDDGPVFGSGRDINIVDKCDVNDCWANLGQTYYCGHKFGSNKANSLMAGQNRFRILQYQIWQVIDADKDANQE